MNSFFKLVLRYSLGLLLSIPTCALAFDIQSFYTSSDCNYTSGFLMAVDEQNIYVLDINGNIVPLKRHNILAVSSYPLDAVPLTTINIAANKNIRDKINLYTVKGKQGKQIVELVTGWLVGFSQEEISFLTTDGKEHNIRRVDIWQITKVKAQPNYNLDDLNTTAYNLLHPRMFDNCEANIIGYKKGTISLDNMDMSLADAVNTTVITEEIAVEPQDFLSNLIEIKNNFENFAEQAIRFKEYHRSQQFYAIPQYFTNLTKLGVWLASGSRYGSNKNRENNGIPILENQFSSGPFGYQHIFFTGASPNDMFIHEEPQAQVFYSFKADYFHLSFFMDPNVLLVGDNYTWQQGDLNQDDRVVDKTFIDVGADYGYISAFLIPGTVTSAYSTVNDHFHETEFNLIRAGIKFTNDFLQVSLTAGSGTSNKETTTPIPKAKEVNIPILETSGEETIGLRDLEYQVVEESTDSIDLSMLRINIHYIWNQDIAVGYSLIKRDFTANYRFIIEETSITKETYFSSCSEPGVFDPDGDAKCGDDISKLVSDPQQIGEALDDDHISSSITHAFYLEYKLNYKYICNFMFSSESYKLQNVSSDNFLKLGANISMFF